jgi:serine/threonine protein kinase
VNPEALQPNDVFGGYVILRKLGQGGFGTVYQAKDPESLAEVAIKVPMREWDATEVRTVEALDHPNIIRVKHIGRDETRGCFVVMPFVTGGSLADRLKDGQRPTATDAARWIAKLARALQHAHERKVVHRDVKPANILFNNANEPLVADFGLALHRDRLSFAPDRSGTRRYQSPEQVKQLGSIVDCRSDIYSLGMVFYELLAGVPPYPKDCSKNDLQRMIIEIPPPPIRTHRADVPAELERICLKMLEKKQSDRPATARDVADELDRFLNRKEETPEKRVLWFAGIGLLLLVTALPTGWIYRDAILGRSTYAYVEVEPPDDDQYIPSRLDLSAQPPVSPDMADFRIENQTDYEIEVCMQKATRQKGIDASGILGDAIWKSENNRTDSHKQRIGIDYKIKIAAHETELRDKLSGSGWYVFHVRRGDDLRWQPYRDQSGVPIGIRNVLNKKFTKLVLTKRGGEPNGTYHWEFQEDDIFEY